MKAFTSAAAALSIAVLTSSLAGPAQAAGSVVHVRLWDKGDAAIGMMGDGMMMGMAMHGKRSKMAMMGVTADAETVPAGEVTFEVTNASKDAIHEMVVSPVRDPSKPLPYDKAMMRVDEEAAGHLGEVSELDPGKSGALRIDLKPGTYILYCNVPGHYALGMWTLVTAKG